MTRVVIAAPSAILRAGLEAIVRSSPALEPVGSAEDWESLEAAVEREQPDVALADLEITAEAPTVAPAGTALVLLADPFAIEALRFGARAVLPRAASSAEILAAIDAAAAGLIVMTPGDLQNLLPAPQRIERATTVEALTPRELEVFRMLAEGAGNKQIAWKLGISEHTVKFHVGSILSKLRASSRTEAVATGVRRGLILL